MDSCRSIAVNRLHWEGCLRPGWWGGWRWTKDGEQVASFAIGAEDGSLLFSYKYRRHGDEWQSVEGPVRIVHLRCQFGVRRPYFLCAGVVTACRAGGAWQSSTGRGSICCAAISFAFLCEPGRRRVRPGAQTGTGYGCGSAAIRAWRRRFLLAPCACGGEPTDACRSRPSDAEILAEVAIAIHSEQMQAQIDSQQGRSRRSRTPIQARRHNRWAAALGRCWIEAAKQMRWMGRVEPRSNSLGRANIILRDVLAALRSCGERPLLGIRCVVTRTGAPGQLAVMDRGQLAECLEIFIRFGESGEMPNGESTAAFLDQSGINRQAPAFWKSVCEDLHDEQLPLLFRGAVIAEKEFELAGGSVSANIWILQCLSARLSPEVTYDLIVWALENRWDRNTWAPFSGHMQDTFIEEGAELLKTCRRDYLSCLRWQKDIKRRIGSESQRAKEQKDQAAAKTRKAKKKRQAELHAEAAVERRAKLHSEIDRVSNMDVEERLHWIVDTTDIPLDAIPEHLFAIDETCAQYGGVPDLDKILKRIERRKGHWKKLADALAARAKQHE